MTGKVKDAHRTEKTHFTRFAKDEGVGRAREIYPSGELSLKGFARHWADKADDHDKRDSNHYTLASMCWHWLNA